jgi:hypothetical protein
MIISGYMLLNANGVYIAMQERTQGWNITPLPTHPLMAITLYLAVGICLQLMSAWLLMPTMIDRRTRRFWTHYAATVGLCIGGSFVAAFVVLFMVMAFLDAGVI